MTFDHIDDDHELDDFVAGIKADAERSDLRPRPDFAEVVRRAQAIAPEAIDDAALDEAASLAEVVPLGVNADPEPPADLELDAFIYDVRRRNRAIADERRMAGIPELALLRARPSSRRPLLAGLLALAAALALLFVSGGPQLAREGAGPTAQAMARQAARLAQEVGRTAAQESATPREAETRGAANTRRATDDGPPNEDIQEDMSEEHRGDEAPELHADAAAARDGGDADPDVDAAKRGRRGKRGKRADADEGAARESREDALAALDVEAQRRWRSGDLAGAESVFREIIRRDPRGRWAQLAYGDLFALVRQTGDRGAELKLWREYLRRHPRGPHADDASAGICRRQRGDAASACWREYLEARPSGAFRSEAKLALAGPPGRAGVDDEVAEEGRP